MNPELTRQQIGSVPGPGLPVPVAPGGCLLGVGVWCLIMDSREVVVADHFSWFVRLSVDGELVSGCAERYRCDEKEGGNGCSENCYLSFHSGSFGLGRFEHVNNTMVPYGKDVSG